MHNLNPVIITNGELAEWSNAAVLKTVVPQGTRGSNPLLSAINFISTFSFFDKELDITRGENIDKL